MKRTRSQVSPTMSPSATNEAFVPNVSENPITNGSGDAIENVVVVGAGPAGLMLA